MAFRAYFVGCNFKRHKKKGFPSLDINWFSDNMVKNSIQQMVSERDHEFESRELDHVEGEIVGVQQCRSYHVDSS
jgi:hypothetical protein